MFDWSIEMDKEGMTVPYDPISDDVRSNRGFVDTRGRPGAASKIMEGRQSSAMKGLLVRVARVGSPIFSVGCDVGFKHVNEGRRKYYYTAGGYVQIMHSNYADRLPQDYARYGEAVANMLEDRANRNDWRLNFVLTPVQFNLDNFCEMTGSLWIWFHSFGDSKRLAVDSRETCIVELGNCLLDVRNLAYLVEE